MRFRLSFLFCFAAVALLLGACSSTTVVARDDRSGVPPAIDTTTDGATSDTASGTQDSAGTDDSSETDAAPDEADESSGQTNDEADGDDRGIRDEDDEPTTPRELEEAEGFGLGGAEQLEGLQADCESGNDMACDILFELSGFDSAEEAVALSCGDRRDTPVIFCTEGVSAIADELVFDLESEGLADIVELCEDDADFTACDFLYFRSPFESEYEEIGATCGGRVQVAVPDCRTFLADS